jgi:hypothetical protein
LSAITERELQEESLVKFVDNRQRKIYRFIKGKYIWGTILNKNTLEAMKKISGWSKGKTLLYTAQREERKELLEIKNIYNYLTCILVISYPKMEDIVTTARC